METEKVLVVSSAHLQESTASHPTLHQEAHVYEKGEYGWFVWAGTEPDHFHGLTDLWSICYLARLHGCAWVMIDRDGPVLETLPEFDW